MSIFSVFGKAALRAAEKVAAEKAAKAAAERAAAETAEAAGRRVVSAAPRESLAVPRTPKALPAPPKRLALPAPKPKSLAAKPRGGQFLPDVPLTARDAQAAGYKVRDRGEHAHPGARYQVVRPTGEAVTSYHASTPQNAFELADIHHLLDTGTDNRSPEAAARASMKDTTWLDDPTSEWLRKSLAKYYKTDFGTEADPLRDLAARGLHYEPDMTPERWQQSVNDSLMEDPIGYYTVPRHASEIMAEHNPPMFSNDFVGDVADTAHALAPGLSYFGNADPIGQGALMQAAPWLRKQPVTDMLYGIKEPLDLGHFADEMRNALNAAESGLPMDLAVRPEMLERMSFPQAVERVGKINQYRAKEMERAALDAQQSPAVQTFKEYTENNPMGLRWTELKAPDDLPEGYSVRQDDGAPREGYFGAYGPDGNPIAWGPTEDDARRMARRVPLQDALKYEGDTMGHCVGGYCPDVMEGRSRIFSLRDAKGEPHVTIETSPSPSLALSGNVINQWEPGAFNRFLDQRYDVGGIENMHEWATANFPEKMSGEDIVQIKGKQNRAPKDDYLPFVQDFVKSQQWGNVGDLRNTQLVKLPDGRYITNQQAEAGIAAIPGTRIYDPSYLAGIGPETWAKLAPYFEGYAIGGRVSADRCFTRHPMSVR